MELKHLPLLDKDLAMDQKAYEAHYAAFAEERNKVQNDPWRLHYHIMPQSGWLNDPNGLCQFHGIYHIYYQYSPFDVEGKTKLWGHMTSKNLLQFQQEEPVLFPDCRGDERGVYSGSAFIKEDTIHYFYTGNVKLFDQPYDYINEGREQNTIHVSSQDGYHFSDKELVLNNQDYPSDMSCHVRDPKIYEKDGIYYMVLGARDRMSRGCVLMYESTDLKQWNYKLKLSSEQEFGYMWECPDLFSFDEQYFLITCPQGVQQQGYRFANVHQCGYFPLDIDFTTGSYELKEFHELDHGFDFYAPQSFEDEQGRRILIGWMGLPDIDYTNPTTKQGWQHALTMPRVITHRNGILYQTPIEEMKELRQEEIHTNTKDFSSLKLLEDCFEMRIDVEQEDDFVLQLRKGATISYQKETKQFTLTLKECGYGRTNRTTVLKELNKLAIYADTSSFEIFVNDGETVFTTRVYSKHCENNVCFLSCDMIGDIRFYRLGSISID